MLKHDRIFPERVKKIILKYLNIYNWLKKNQSCLLCEGKTEHSRGWIFCTGCLSDLPWLIHSCWQCGIDLVLPHKKCTNCVSSPPYFDWTVTLFAYQPPISQMLIQYKYQGKLYYVPTFADMLALKIMATYKKKQRALPDIILGVPLSLPRLKQRGFNQSLEVVKHLSQTLDIPYHSSVIKRIRDTPMQAGLSLKQRQANLKKAFDFVGQAHIRRFIQNKRIAVVDDVLTTGSTLNILAKLLKDAGARSVDNWVLARTLPKIS